MTNCRITEKLIDIDIKFHVENVSYKCSTADHITDNDLINFLHLWKFMENC